MSAYFEVYKRYDTQLKMYQIRQYIILINIIAKCEDNLIMKDC